MEIGSADRLNTIMMSLSDWSEELRIQGYPIAARLLAMANLELRMKRHNISDSDFQALCATLDINRIATNGEKQSYPRRGLRRSAAHHGRADESSDRQIQHQAAAATSYARETDF